MSKEAIVPIVNLNGTSKEELIRQAHNMANTLSACRKALGEMTPHGRDYCGDTERYKAARQQYHELCNKLEEISYVIYGIWEGITAQGRQR